jgi:decaprenylphospho-beta-D-ribofuranose 2-oxidase
MSSPAMENKFLQTYALNEGKRCNIHTPASVEDLSLLLKNFQKEERSFSLLGGRNSFGDVFIPSGNDAVDLTGLPKRISLNQGTVTVDAAVNSFELWRYLKGSDFYIPAQAGSYLNTLGGDISANVNGKDSWKRGNFYNNIISIKVLLASGEIMEVNKHEPELFNSVVGGLGLIGIILSAELKLQPKISDKLLCRRIATRNISETIVCFKELQEDQIDFAYAWTDCLAKGKDFGRSVINTARFVEGNNFSDAGPSTEGSETIFGLKDDLFWGGIRNTWGLLQKIKLDTPVMKAFNSLRYSYLKRKADSEVIKNYSEYQFPVWNVLPNWNKRFIPRGMQELQCLFGFETFEAALRQLIKQCHKHGVCPELCAIKRHKPDNSFLSFSGDGLSCTINYDRNNNTDKELYTLERELIETVIKFGGKVYLAKFPYLNREELRAMYPAFDKFRKIKLQYDPRLVLMSAAWQRWMS